MDWRNNKVYRWQQSKVLKTLEGEQQKMGYSVSNLQAYQKEARKQADFNFFAWIFIISVITFVLVRGVL